MTEYEKMHNGELIERYAINVNESIEKYKYLIDSYNSFLKKYEVWFSFL